MNSTYFILSVSTAAILIFVEWAISNKGKKEIYPVKDTLSNLFIGIVVLVTSTLSKVLMLGFYSLIYKFRFFTMGGGGLVCFAAFIANDFTFYWFHRAAHQINLFWISHSVHHSSEHYNISVAFRQSWLANFNGQFLFWLWMPLAGFNPVMVLLAYQLAALYQLWLHTELIYKLPAYFEFIFNTPSHHRVHHASNPGYIDKNHSAVLIIWDRIFGTYAEETEPPVYGITKPVRSINPFVIVTHGIVELARDLSKAGSIQNVIKYLVKYPGWQA